MLKLTSLWKTDDMFVKTVILYVYVDSCVTNKVLGPKYVGFVVTEVPGELLLWPSWVSFKRDLGQSSNFWV